MWFACVIRHNCAIFRKRSEYHISHCLCRAKMEKNPNLFFICRIALLSCGHVKRHLFWSLCQLLVRIVWLRRSHLGVSANIWARNWHFCAKIYPMIWTMVTLKTALVHGGKRYHSHGCREKENTRKNGDHTRRENYFAWLSSTSTVSLQFLKKSGHHLLHNHVYRASLLASLLRMTGVFVCPMVGLLREIGDIGLGAKSIAKSCHDELSVGTSEPLYLWSSRPPDRWTTIGRIYTQRSSFLF